MARFGLCSFLYLCLIFSLIPTGILAQEFNEFGIESGELNDHPHLKLILSISLTDQGRFGIDRNIWKEHELSADERKEKLIAEWMGRGMEREQAERFAGRGRAQQATSGMHDLVRELTTKARITSMSGNSHTSTYHNRELRLVVGMNPRDADAFTLKAYELGEPGRKLEVSEDTDGLFDLLLRGEGYVLMVDQKSDGPMRIITILGDDLFQYRGDSFLDFMEKHPQRAEHLLKVLESHGFDPPPLESSTRVTDEAKKQLETIHAESNQEIEQLLEELESDEFTKREAAEKRLKELYETKAPVLRAKLADDKTSLAIRTVLSKVVKEGDSKPGDQRALKFLTNQGLLSSPKFLASLLAESNEAERAAVFMQLDSVTGQSFSGSDEELMKYLENHLDSEKDDK